MSSPGVERKLTAPHTLVIALTNVATIYVFRRELEATLAVTEEAMRISDQLGIIQFHAWASIHRGWALGTRSRPMPGLQRSRRGWRPGGPLVDSTTALTF